ncbi:MAG TPA: hypothetical protein ENI99_04375 [Sedimenticola sp.]|nr:hypothetical protein [Sedimenticola sp.]
MHSGIAAVFQQKGQALADRKLHFVLVILASLVMASPVSADYLSELESEAESSAGVPSEGVAGSLPSRGGAIGSSRSVEGGRKSFERALKAERPHVYTFYSRLPETDKARVADYHARSSGKMSKTVNLILDLYFQKK